MGNIGIPPIPPDDEAMPDDEKKYNVTVEEQAASSDTSKSEVAGKTAAAATPAVTTVPAAAAPSVDAQAQNFETARIERERIREDAKDERADRKEEAAEARETRKEDAVVAADIRAKAATADSDIRNKDFIRIILAIVVTGVVTMSGNWFVARNASQKIDAMDAKVGRVEATGDKTLQHVNSAHLANLKTILRLNQRQYATSGEEADRKEVEDAQRAVDEHEAADTKIEASRKNKG